MLDIMIMAQASAVPVEIMAQSTPAVPIEISPELKDFASKIAWLLAAAWVIVLLAKYATPSGRSGMNATGRLTFWHFIGGALFIYILMDLDRLPEFVNMVMKFASWVGDFIQGAFGGS